ncbi:hypothetical protein [Haloterrigena alkaliphila]|uniref:Uncharacterized protein n=1 Tax=Haloterrigena alkaliphila TaxID=2816475 RepID=A0A8A2VFG7_9EURY|nr:hypothetical protein [Haloterrigena alkaliphila]QSX00854.1 hypothetical protein J0X25_07815 [Haloterrigena alkaliphila]
MSDTSPDAGIPFSKRRLEAVLTTGVEHPAAGIEDERWTICESLGGSSPS